MSAMSYFLVEIRMSDAGQHELERVARTLEAAQTRLRRTATATRTIVAGLTGDDGRLVCLIEATSLETVRRLVSMAFLPAARIREITHVTGTPVADPNSQTTATGGGLLRGGYPGGNLDPGVEAELVEDVVHVCLHGALGQE
jgi:hypothetical protein